MLAIDHALLKDLERFRNGRVRGTAAAGRVGADESVDGTHAVMAAQRRSPRRRRNPNQGEIEDQLFKCPRWSGLQEQVELQTRNHSEQENCAAHRRCKELLKGGWGSINWVEVYGQK